MSKRNCLVILEETSRGISKVTLRAISGTIPERSPKEIL